jgi:hypothetical protein
LEINLPFYVSLLAEVAEANADFLNSLSPNAVISRPFFSGRITDGRGIREEYVHGEI